jgi:hypothetical protein
MPGVSVTTGTISGPSAPARAPSSTYFVAGLLDRGPTDKPVKVFSFAQFQRLYGDRPSYGSLWDDVRMFFQEGGTQACVLRIVGPAATTGALATPLADRAVTPDDTLNVAAANAGAWSTHVSVKVLDGATAATFRLQVLFDGIVVEDYSALSSPQAAVSRVNATSSYVRLADAASASTAPTNNPVAVGPVALAAGTDDRASVITSSYTGALDKFVRGLGDGAVALPGIGQSVHAALIAHADANNRLAILANGRGDSQTTLASYAASLDAKRAGLFAPWVQVPDGFGGTRPISPEGYVAACRARAHESVGPWRAAAGEIAKARYVVAPDQEFTAAAANDLDASKVNIIRTIANAVRLYGWRSLSADTDNWALLTGADVINRIVVEAEKQLEPFVFDTIDSSGHLLATIGGTLTGIVIPMANAGGLYALRDVDETLLDPGYAVNVSDSINPNTSLALNQIFAELGVRVSPSAAQVHLMVSKAGVTAAL